jgi:hypothetical protein
VRTGAELELTGRGIIGRTFATIASGACIAGCSLIVDATPKSSDATLDAVDAVDAPDEPAVEFVDTRIEIPDVEEDFTPGCAAGAAAAGARHVCGVFEGGRVMCWGDGAQGQLGVDGVDSSDAPLAVPGLEAGVETIAAGGTHGCVVDGAGQVRCFGAPFATEPEPVTPSGAPLHLAAGDGFGCAALETGAVECFGEPEVAELEGVHATSGAAVDICAGDEHVCAAIEGGALECWGANTFGQVGNGGSGEVEPGPREVDLPAGATSVACGRGHTCAALEDGSVWCWGANDAGQLGDGTTEGRTLPVEVSGLDPAGARAVSAGGSHSCALLWGGAVQCWGENDRGQLGNADPGVAAAVARDVEGLMAAAVAVTAGADHCCAVLETGAVMCWGANASGQLGDGSRHDRPVPVWVRASCP